MIAYTICFVRRGDQVLLLNRERSSWMGCWNGVGGKLEQGETARDSMIRELREETGIASCALHFKGLVTWLVDGGGYGGMYAYLAEVADDYALSTPMKTEEGILDWKERAWILHPNNAGLAANIPVCLDAVLDDPGCYDHHVVYERGILQAHHAAPIDPAMEYDERTRALYFERTRGQNVR